LRVARQIWRYIEVITLSYIQRNPRKGLRDTIAILCSAIGDENVTFKEIPERELRVDV
jgi:hypothetical protein